MTDSVTVRMDMTEEAKLKTSRRQWLRMGPIVLHVINSYGDALDPDISIHHLVCIGVETYRRDPA